MTVLAHSVRESGGMERTQHHVVAGLLDRGWKVRVLAWECDVPDHPGLTYVRLPVPRRPFVVEHPAYAALVELVLAVRPEPGITTSLGANVLRAVDVTTVQYVHHATGPRTAQTVTGAKAALYGRYAAASAGLAEAFERYAYRPDRVGHVITVSRALRDELVASFPAIADRITIVPNGTDSRTFRPDAAHRADVRAALGVSDDTDLAIFAGGDWGRKGLRVAVEALAAAPNWHLLVIGRGEASDEAAFATETGVGERVHFAGVVGDPERYFAAADAFVLPTAYEGFPLVTIEAAASGLPLLVTAEANAEAILKPGLTGWALPREPAAFARQLTLLAGDSQLRDRMGAAARTAAEGLDWPGIVDRHEAIYHDALERRASVTRRR